MTETDTEKKKYVDTDPFRKRHKNDISLIHDGQQAQYLLKGKRALSKEMLPYLERGFTYSWVIKSQMMLKKGGLLISNNYPDHYVFLCGRRYNKVPVKDRVFYINETPCEITKDTKYTHYNIIYKTLKSEKFVLVEKKLLDYIESKIKPELCEPRYVERCRKMSEDNSKIHILNFPKDAKKIIHRMRKYRKLTKLQTSKLKPGDILFVRFPKNETIFGPMIMETNAYPNALVLRSERNPNQIVRLLKKDLESFVFYKKKVDPVKQKNKYKDIDFIVKAIRNGTYKIVAKKWLENVELEWEDDKDMSFVECDLSTAL
jgi:hypothetical protein